jgi:VIT1/CCC1 family predicted Fe2+/Mn2+ transporter
MESSDFKKPSFFIHVETFLGDIVLGINDGLVSILGFVAGAYGAIENNLLVFITGVAATVAAALSMGAAVYLARKSEKELKRDHVNTTIPAVKAGFATAIAFILFSLFPLLPYILISGFSAFVTSIILTLFALFAAGALKTLITREYEKWFIRGLEMMAIGAITALISYGVGLWISSVTGMGLAI